MQTALSLGDLEQTISENDNTHFDRVVFIDSTWDQAHSIISVSPVQIQNITLLCNFCFSSLEALGNPVAN